MKKIPKWWFATVVSVLAASFAHAMNGELDQGVLQAERSLRAAEARAYDDVAVQLYRRAIEQAEAGLSRNPDSAGANFVYFAARSRILLADGLTEDQSGHSKVGQVGELLGQKLQSPSCESYHRHASTKRRSAEVVPL